MILQQTNFFLQVAATTLKLIQRRLIPWGRTPHGCSNITVRQSQTISYGLRLGLIGESMAIQRLIQPISTPITGKDSSRPISTMGRGRQPQNIESSLRISSFCPLLAPGSVEANDGIAIEVRGTMTPIAQMKDRTQWIIIHRLL